ncbi:MAG: 23S rRNA (adenine(2503)-C(2))-methyltransferase RlmN, partial [Patescibacteria group bacterium]
IKNSSRNTVCVSSQIGCPLGCSFCATGDMGFKRNLSVSEIVEQVLLWARYLKKQKERVHPVKSGFAGPDNNREFNRVNNIVFMGMWEPFLNYDNVFEAIKILNDDNLLGIGARHISISTAGIIEGIERMADDMPQINLAISLHAPDDALRQKLMPIDKKYPLADIMTAVKDYVVKTNRKLMFEYIMIKGVNDSQEQAKELAGLMGNRLFFVNLIAYNRQGASEPIIANRYNLTGAFAPSEPAQIKKFKDILMKAGIQALERYRFGQDIAGACGQLAVKGRFYRKFYSSLNLR